MNLKGVPESTNFDDYTGRSKMDWQTQHHLGADLNDYERDLMKKHKWTPEDMLILRYMTSPEFHQDALDNPRVPDRRAP